MTLRWLTAGILIAMLSGGFQTRSAPASSIVVLKVHLLATSDGGESGGTGLFAERYPKTITVQNATRFSGRIAAYGAAYRVWIAPNGWTGSAGIRFDGGTDVDLYPISGPSSRGPRFHYENSGGCAGCAIESAAPYFASAMRQWKEFFSYSKLSPVHRGLNIIRVSSSVVTYSYPSGHDLLAHGVIHFESSDQFFEKAEFVLPRTDAKLSDFLLQKFISAMKLK